MYENQKKNVKKAANQIVDNLNDIAEAKGTMGKGYLSKGKAAVDITIPMAESGVEKKLGQFMDKQVKNVKASSKKVKVDVE